MARQLRPRERLLLGLLSIAGLIAIYFLVRGDGALFGGRGAEADKELKPLGDPPVVDMAALARATTDYDPAGRDLFDYYVPPPPPRPPPAAVVQKELPPPPPRPPRQQPVIPPPPSLPQPDFQYLGYLGPKNQKIAVFEAGQEILLAEVGDVVRERFRVVEFRYETVVLGYEEEAYRGKTTELKLPPR